VQQVISSLAWHSILEYPLCSGLAHVKVGQPQEIVGDEIPAAPTTLLVDIVSNGLLATPPIVRGSDHAQPGFFCLLEIESASVGS
jgi:hypothetical protein